MAKETIDYQLLHNTDPDKLSADVRRHLELEWKLHGDTRCCSGLFYQAMIKIGKYVCPPEEEL